MLTAPIANMMTMTSPADAQENTYDSFQIPEARTNASPQVFEDSAMPEAVQEAEDDEPSKSVNDEMILDPAIVSGTVEDSVSRKEKRIEHNMLQSQVSASSLVSPPASSDNDAGSSPAAEVSDAKIRQVFQASQEHYQRYTPDSSSTGRASNSSEADGSVDKEPSRANEGEGSRKSETQADENSLRLIKELQAQDLGLRRRGRA